MKKLLVLLVVGLLIFSCENIGTADNELPIADAGTDLTGTAGQAVTFDGSGSSDADGDILTLIWDFGDSENSVAGVGERPSHTYTSAGTYTVVLTVMDGQDSVTDSIRVTIAAGNSSPVADAGNNFSGLSGSALPFDGSGSSDGDDDTLTYSWNFGDGTVAGTGATPSHSYTNPGVYTVVLTVSDGNANDSDSIIVNITAPVVVSNSVPVADAGVNQTGARMEILEFDGTGSSDADGDDLTYLWDFGDNNYAGTGEQTQHQYQSGGTYTVTLTVSDGRSFSTDTMEVLIPNTAPVADAGNNLSINPGNELTFDGSDSIDDDGQDLTYSWDFGDSSAAGTGVTPTHTYSEEGIYTVTLTVSDGEDSSTDTLLVNVNLKLASTLGISSLLYDVAALDPDDVGVTAEITEAGAILVDPVYSSYYSDTIWTVVQSGLEITRVDNEDIDLGTSPSISFDFTNNGVNVTSLRIILISTSPVNRDMYYTEAIAAGDSVHINLNNFTNAASFEEVVAGSSEQVQIFGTDPTSYNACDFDPSGISSIQIGVYTDTTNTGGSDVPAEEFTIDNMVISQ